mgnify:CR=1 FL=1
MQAQARETLQRFATRESHILWGRWYLLTVIERETKPGVTLDHKLINLTLRPGSDMTKRAAVMHDWHKGLLPAAVPPLIRQWEPKLQVRIGGYFLQRTKTQWGSCNHGLPGTSGPTPNSSRSRRTCWNT